MRVLTRLTAAVVTAGALIAPATMPAAHAATVVSAVTHVGAVTPGTFVPEQAPLNGGYALQPGQTLTIRNLYVDVPEAQTYTITNQAGTAQQSVTVQRLQTGSLTVPVKDGSTYVLRSTSDASFTFVAL